MLKLIRICCLVISLLFPQTLWSLTEIKDPLTADIQFYLKHLGYRVGSKAGFEGPITQRAIRQYENDYGLQITGKGNQKLLNHLRKAYFKGHKTYYASSSPYPLQGKLKIQIPPELIRDCRMALKNLAHLAIESANQADNLKSIETTYNYTPYVKHYPEIPAEVDNKMKDLSSRLSNLDYHLWKASRFCSRLYIDPAPPRYSTAY
tara:strand:- start:123 stop:737 length:615 start_codon:yes stop_codon:yes gene_type:complete